MCDALMSSLGNGGCDPAVTGVLLQRTVGEIARHGDALTSAAAAPSARAPGGAELIPPPLLHDPVPLCLELVKRILRHMHAAGIAVVHAADAAPGSCAAVRVPPLSGSHGGPLLPQLVRLADAAVQLCRVVFDEAVVYARWASRAPLRAAGDGAQFVPAAFAKRLAVLLTLQRYSLAAADSPSPVGSGDGSSPVPPALLPPPSLRLTAAHVLQLWAAVNDGAPPLGALSPVPPGPPRLLPVNHAPREVFWAWARQVCGGGRWDVTTRRLGRGGSGASSTKNAIATAAKPDGASAVGDVSDEAANALLAGEYRAPALAASGGDADALPQRIRSRSHSYSLAAALSCTSLLPDGQVGTGAGSEHTDGAAMAAMPVEDGGGATVAAAHPAPSLDTSVMYEALSDPEDLLVAAAIPPMKPWSAADAHAPTAAAHPTLLASSQQQSGTWPDQNQAPSAADAPASSLAALPSGEDDTNETWVSSSDDGSGGPASTAGADRKSVV
jgi:hypothetical protein